MKTIDRLPNIYLTKDGEYYYSTKPDKRQDKTVEHHVTTEYAFNFCARMNFNDKSKEVSRQTKRNIVYVPSSGDKLREINEGIFKSFTK